MFPVEMLTFEAAEGCGKGGGEEIPPLPAPASAGCHFITWWSYPCMLRHLFVWLRI